MTSSNAELNASSTVALLQDEGPEVPEEKRAIFYASVELEVISSFGSRTS
jgi:hypothetical protein